MSDPLTAADVFHEGDLLSKPVPRAALLAFREDASRLAPVTDPAVTHGLTDAGHPTRLTREQLEAIQRAFASGQLSVPVRALQQRAA